MKTQSAKSRKGRPGTKPGTILNDLTNKRFGRLTAISPCQPEEGKHRKWLCKCECGNKKEIVGKRLSNGTTRSCGCLQQEKVSERSGKLDHVNKLHKLRQRAGPRKCRRCKVVFNRQKGEMFIICERCRVHCSRCDVELTDKTEVKSSGKRTQYLCKKCAAETARNNNNDTNKRRRRDYNLLRNYGITVDEYEAILEDQKDVCWICQNPPKNNCLSVDHKHEKGEKRRDPREKRSRVRGLLCWQCNAALGKFKDDPNLMRRAAKYMETCPAQKILKGEQ